MAKQFLNDVLSIIKPTSDELAKELHFANGLIKRIQANAPKNSEVVLTGSVAKCTFLRDQRDVDIFVLFDRSMQKEKLESTIKYILESTFPKIGYQVSYAEHPYVRFHFEGRRIDLVPAYKISKAAERISAVDRSVLHTKFVKKHLKAKQRDEVLLLKQFLKANSVYGAEIKIAGFSGYLCELLIIKYGTFMKLLQHASNWKEPIFIDLQNYYKKKRPPQFDFFTVIDPTDKNRNVAAAVSRDNFKKFTKLCKTFLKKPSKTAFLKKPETFEQKLSKTKGKTIFTISMPRPDVVDDVLWGQLHRMMKQLNLHLKDFKPKKIFADDTRHIIRIAVVLSLSKLPSKMLIEGPPLKMKPHIKAFRNKHKRARFIKRKNKIYAEVNNPMTKPESAIQHFFKHFNKSKSHLAYPEEMFILERQ
ncbi:CCA tRNA nucleotidyltransferase [Candidatus Micrarchaeota archaeon]|nr:CCA tRNA nucleotidyltransferase [Candidatus Micrarchaeota archaeon]